MCLNLLHDYYTHASPNRRVLELCGALERDTPYTREQDEELTVIINAYARPAYLPLIWEAIQYQTRRPKETWIVQNRPPGGRRVPRGFFRAVRDHGDDYNPRWSSIQAYEMGSHPAAMHVTGGLAAADEYLHHCLSSGWSLMRYAASAPLCGSSPVERALP